MIFEHINLDHGHIMRGFTVFSYFKKYMFTIKTKKVQPGSEDMELCISVDLFKSTFPFSLLLDRKLDIIQFGDSLMRHLGQSMLSGFGSHLFTYFKVESPKLNEYSFESIFINKNMNYRLKMKMVDERNGELKDMEIKGSMIYVEEMDCLLFIGSPVLLDLDELTGRGLYISDIPIHDAARDIILVGEQTKAQVRRLFLEKSWKRCVILIIFN